MTDPRKDARTPGLETTFITQYLDEVYDHWRDYGFPLFEKENGLAHVRRNNEQSSREYRLIELSRKVVDSA